MSRSGLSRRAILWIIALLQGLTVLGFAGTRELDLRRGTEIVLATVPVDPRDLFRGDYVVLRYEISTRPGCFEPAGSTLYVRLQRGDVWRATGHSVDLDSALRGADAVIAGRVTARTSGACIVEYGIENYFVEEGRGRDIERARGQLRVHVIVSGEGSATIKRLELP